MASGIQLASATAQGAAVQVGLFCKGDAVKFWSNLSTFPQNVSWWASLIDIIQEEKTNLLKELRQKMTFVQM